MQLAEVACEFGIDPGGVFRADRVELAAYRAAFLGAHQRREERIRVWGEWAVKSVGNVVGGNVARAIGRMFRR